MSCCYKTTLPDSKPDSIKRVFLRNKGMIFLSFDTFDIPSTPITLDIKVRNSARTSAERKGVLIGESLVKEALKSKMYEHVDSQQSIHVDLAWNYHGGKKQCRHAMSLIYFPRRGVLEFFDPTGYSTRSNAPSQDVFMKVVLLSIAKTINVKLKTINKKYSIIKIVNMNMKSLNPDGHCNTWSLFLHYLRHYKQEMTSTMFKKYILSYYNVIHDNPIHQKNLLQPIHKLFMSRLNNIVPGLNQLIDTRHGSS